MTRFIIVNAGGSRYIHCLTAAIALPFSVVSGVKTRAFGEEQLA